MKNQYFGDINDYRKYGLLTILTANGATRLGVCWMLTPNDNSTDGGHSKLRYLKNKNVERWQEFNKTLYARIRRKIWNSSKDEVANESRLVSHFDDAFVPGSEVWHEDLEDCPIKRSNYFERMFASFKDKKVSLIFFDPDNGLAGKVGHLSIRKGAKASSKHLFCDEVNQCIDHQFSALVYQHFRQKSSIVERKKLIKSVTRHLQILTSAKQVACFVTPDVFYVLIPAKTHEKQLLATAANVAKSTWATLTGYTRSRITNCKQIAVCFDPE